MIISFRENEGEKRKTWDLFITSPLTGFLISSRGTGDGVPGAVPGAGAPVDVGEESLTLYVNNLNDKIHPDTLAKNLREVFGAFGEIQDLICMKSPGGAPARFSAHVFIPSSNRWCNLNCALGSYLISSFWTGCCSRTHHCL